MNDVLVLFLLLVRVRVSAHFCSSRRHDAQHVVGIANSRMTYVQFDDKFDRLDSGALDTQLFHQVQVGPSRNDWYILFRVFQRHDIPYRKECR